MSHTLKVTVHSAEGMDDVEHFGKNDPYVQVGLNLKDPKAFVKTTVKKNAGKHAEWNQTLSVEEYDPNTQHELYVEIFDKETTIDAPIGFLAIPLRQVTEAPNSIFRGAFNIFKPDGKEKGTISLTLAVVQAGQAAPNVTVSEVRGQSQVVTEHQNRIKSAKNHEKAADVGIAAAIVGGVFGAKKLHDSHKESQKAKEAAQAEALEQ
ncbi:hypothetical protein BG011_008739 [Mortierella polycephala]|uniref:C2 domain-containing protein n=1 Tax=Mortierella polycephala TaxID=41804 RepID=A0A9P6PPH6_9FUNG|nr:hypothetical protein BG011_008739 [Mortierella polycephala]